MRLGLKLLVSGGLVALLVWQLGGLHEVGALLGGLDPAWAVLILAVNWLDRSLMTFKWARLLGGRGIHLPFYRGLKIYCASMIWGTFLPTSVGADAVRTVSAARSGIDIKEVVASIAIERWIGALVALVLGLVSLGVLAGRVGLGAEVRAVWWACGGALVVGTGMFVASFSARAFDLVHEGPLRGLAQTRVGRALHGVHAAYRAYGSATGRLAVFGALTVLEQLVVLVIIWCIAHGLGIPLGPVDVLATVPLIFLLTRLPIAIDGLGLVEWTFVGVMALVGLSAAEAVAIAVVGRIMQILSWLPWAIAHVMEPAAAGARG